jgi:hypothetical protein
MKYSVQGQVDYPKSSVNISGSNLICLCSQLKALAPQHVVVQNLETAEEQFAKAASAFQS